MRSNCCWDSHSTTRRESCKKGWISSAARTRACSPPLLLLLLLLWDVEGRGDDIIILESMQIRRPHENGRAAFSDFSTLRPVFKKVRVQFSGSVWTVGQNDAIHVCFRKRALSSGRARVTDPHWAERKNSSSLLCSASSPPPSLHTCRLHHLFSWILLGPTAAESSSRPEERLLTAVMLGPASIPAQLAPAAAK